MTSIESLRDVEIALENELKEIEVKYKSMLGKSCYIYFESKDVEAQYFYDYDELEKLHDKCFYRLYTLREAISIVRFCYDEISDNEKINSKDKFAEYYHRLLSVSK